MIGSDDHRIEIDHLAAAICMHLPDEILERLRCPVTGSLLIRADEALLELINGQIAAGQAQTRLSEVVRAPVRDALVNADRTLLYRIDDGLITLLAGEAIEIEEDTTAENLPSV